MLFQYPTGRFADRIGRRPVLLAGLVVYGVASLAFLLAHRARGGHRRCGACRDSGAGAAAVASLAMISGAVAVERRGRAFASIYAGESPGWRSGRWSGASSGVHHMWAMFLASGVAAFVACIPALAHHRGGADHRAPPAGTGRRHACRLARVVWRRPMTGALSRPARSASPPASTTSAGRCSWWPGARPGWQIGISWTMFAVPFVLLASPSGWLADHMDRRALVLGGLGLAASFCASYPFIHSVPALITLGAIEAFGFAAAMPSIQSLLTQGSAQSEVGRVQGTLRDRPDRAAPRWRQRAPAPRSRCAPGSPS